MRIWYVAPRPKGRRTIASVATVLALAVLAGCGRSTSPWPAPINLIRLLPSAERRAAGPADRAITSDFVNVNGALRPALLMTAPARVTYSLRFPGAAAFRSRVALLSAGPAPARGVVVRVGISDGRSFDDLLRLTLDPPAPSGSANWRDIRVDLGAYSGWQWSLFYHPSRITWQFILNADPQPAGSVAWVEPVIDGT